MPRYHATVLVKRRKSILDPEGKAIEHALLALEYGSCTGVRVGRIIEFQVEAADEAEAGAVVASAGDKLLSNPIMEDFTYTLTREA